MNAERFWMKVVGGDVDTCWEWTGAIDRSGYGVFTPVRGQGMYKAHRLAYESLRGQIPPGLVIDHLCRNRACVNPWHLEPVTVRENNVRAGEYARSRTHCRRGHEWSPENTRFDVIRGTRHCRPCGRQHQCNHRLKDAA